MSKFYSSGKDTSIKVPYQPVHAGHVIIPSRRPSVKPFKLQIDSARLGDSYAPRQYLGEASLEEGNAKE